MFKQDTHKFDSEHYWEINKKGFNEKRIQDILIDDNWELVLNNRLFENPYHRFYLLKKYKN